MQYFFICNYYVIPSKVNLSEMKDDFLLYSIVPWSYVTVYKYNSSVGTTV
jgi:hypothetical protein